MLSDSKLSDKEAKDPKAVFREYCAANGMRYTPEREVIINEIYRKYEHFDIDNLFLRIRQRHPHIRLAKGSIYRTLPHLIKAGLVRVSFAEDGHICYEKTIGHQHHDHMKCLECGKIIDFYADEIDKLQAEQCKRHQFKMVWHVHVLGGYCSKCSGDKSKRTS